MPPLAALAAQAAFAACVSTQHERLTDAVYPPTPPEQPIVVYASLEALGGRPHERLAVLRAIGNTKATWELVVADMQQRARQLGADAIVIQSAAADYEGTMPSLTGQLEDPPWADEGVPQFEKRGVALAIRFRDVPRGAEASPAGHAPWSPDVQREVPPTERVESRAGAPERRDARR